MLSPKFGLLTLLATAGFTSAANLRREVELTTTSTEIIYVTITHTLTTSGSVYYTEIITPSLTLTKSESPYPTTTEIPYPTTTEITYPTTTEATETTETTETTYPTTTEAKEESTTDTDVPYKTDDYNTTTIAVNGTTTATITPSGGFKTTIRANTTTYSTSGPIRPSGTEEAGAAGRVGAGSVVALMGFIGAVVAMF